MDHMNLQPENQAAAAGPEVGKLFRSALHGFHKQDVAEYIERMARDRRRDAERYGAHIRSLEEAREAAAEELESLRTQVTDLVREAYTANEAKDEAEKTLESLRGEQETAAAELESLRRTVKTLEEEKAAVSAQCGTCTAEPSAELEMARQAAAEKEKEIERLRSALELAQRENSRLLQELETARSHVPIQSSGAELINRVRPRAAASQNTDPAAMQVRIDRARQCVQDGISECSALYHEMQRNIERLEEILRNLNE